jgi:hypothetical protein
MIFHSPGLTIMQPIVGEGIRTIRDTHTMYTRARSPLGERCTISLAYGGDDSGALIRCRTDGGPGENLAAQRIQQRLVAQHAHHGMTVGRDHLRRSETVVVKRTDMALIRRPRRRVRLLLDDGSGRTPTSHARGDSNAFKSAGIHVERTPSHTRQVDTRLRIQSHLYLACFLRVKREAEGLCHHHPPDPSFRHKVT